MLAKQNRFVVAAFEILLVVISVTAAWLLRFEFRIPDWRVLVSVLPLLIVLRLLALARFNLLHGYWRYAGISDAIDIQKARMPDPSSYIPIGTILCAVDKLSQANYLPGGLK